MNPIGWFELRRRPRRPHCVLRETLGVTLVLNEPHAQSGNAYVSSRLCSYGASGAIAVEGVPTGANSTMVYFSCEDCAVPESKVEEAGGEVVVKAAGKYGLSP